MTKEKRSNKWTFLIYKDSAPENYINVLNELQIPYILSPWHDKDINLKTGNLKKAHRHGALFFESLKSYSQVSELVIEKLNSPSHIEVVMSTKGMYDYFTHAENKNKTTYNIKDITSGCGFELDKFLKEQDSDKFLSEVIDIIEKNNLKEFQELVSYAKNNNYKMLSLIFKHTFFFAKYIDSKRWGETSEKDTEINKTNQ